MKRANADTTGHKGKSQGIAHDEWLGRKLRGKTARGGDAGISKEQNKDLTSKRVPINLTALPTTHKLAIDLRLPITANSPPNPPSQVQTVTNSTKMSPAHSRSTSAASSTGNTSSSSAGPYAKTLCNHVHHQVSLIESFTLAIANEMKQMPVPGTMGASRFGGADIIKVINRYKSLSSCTRTELITKGVIATFPYCRLETITDTSKLIDGYLR